MFDTTEEDVIELIKDFELNELLICWSVKILMLLKDLTLILQVHQINVCFVIIGILKMLD